MKPTIKWYDLYSISFPHQSTFIRRTCFDTMGLYDENARLLQIGNGLSLPSYTRTLPMNLFHLSLQSVNMEVLVKQINVIWS